MGIPGFDDVETNWVEDVYRSFRSCGADIATPFHNHILIRGLDLSRQTHSMYGQKKRHTSFIISPLLTSIINIWSWSPATMISLVPFEVKLIQRRSFILSWLHIPGQQFARSMLAESTHTLYAIMESHALWPCGHSSSQEL